MPQGRSKDSAYHRSLLSSTVCMDVTIYPVLVFMLSFFGLALSAWIGVLFSRNRGVEAQVREDFGIILAATLTLLGLIVGFTFSMALGRYDQRKNYEEEKANAIGTEYARAGLLPAADAAKVRALLLNYLDQRIFTQNMLELSMELIAYDRSYEDMAFKCVEHFLYIAAAMNKPGPDGMWDEEDGFYYDLLRLPDGSATRLKVRSLVGLLPLCATTIIEASARERIPGTMAQINERLHRIPELLKTIHPTGSGHFGVAERGIMALVNPERLRRILTQMLDENEFLSPYGIRSLSKYHERHPYIF